MPTLQPFVDADRVKDQILARAEARNPEAVAELRDCEVIARVYRGVLATARRAVAEVVRITRPSSWSAHSPSGVDLTD